MRWQRNRHKPQKELYPRNIHVKNLLLRGCRPVYQECISCPKMLQIIFSTYMYISGKQVQLIYCTHTCVLNISLLMSQHRGVQISILHCSELLQSLSDVSFPLRSMSLHLKCYFQTQRMSLETDTHFFRAFSHRITWASAICLF